MTTSSNGLAALVAAALFVAPAIAVAQPAGQPTAADLESARELYKEAKALRDKGDLRGALEKFKQAHAYGQTPVTALELGRTHMQLGELVEAREVFLSVARMKVLSDEGEKSASARQETADLAEQLRPKIPTLNIKITGVPADAQPQVSVDGAAIPVVSLTAVRKANPGPHGVVAKLGGKEQKVDVAVNEGETKDVLVSLDGATVTGGGGGAGGGGNGAGGGPEPDKGPRVISPVVWAGVGLGAAGLAVGTITGIIALGKSSTVKNECKGTACPTTAKHDVDSGRTMATISTIGFVAAGVGAGVAAVGYFVLSKPASTGSRPHVTPVVAGNWIGLDGAF